MSAPRPLSETKEIMYYVSKGACLIVIKYLSVFFFNNVINSFQIMLIY